MVTLTYDCSRLPPDPPVTGPVPPSALGLADAAAGLKIPPALQPGITRHRVHLSQLAATLRAGGMPDPQILASLNSLVASYRAELIRTLASLQKVEHDA